VSSFKANYSARRHLDLLQAGHQVFLKLLPSLLFPKAHHQVVKRLPLQLLLLVARLQPLLKPLTLPSPLLPLLTGSMLIWQVNPMGQM